MNLSFGAYYQTLEIIGVMRGLDMRVPPEKAWAIANSFYKKHKR